MKPKRRKGRQEKPVEPASGGAETDVAPVEAEIVLAPDEEEGAPEVIDGALIDADTVAEPIVVDEEGDESVEDAAAGAAAGRNLPEIPKTREIAPLDPLSAYLREVSRYPALSREEEHELAVRYFQDKDLQAAYKLVTSNLWLVVKTAREYEKAARSVLDLIQEGNIGLMEAVKNFDPYRGVRLPSYAVWWIKAYIVRYIIANWRLVKIGTTQAQRKLFFNLKKEKDRLEREGFYPTPKLLADRLSVRESDVVEMEQRLGGADVSVDAPLHPDSEGESNLLGVMAGSELSAEDILAQKQREALLRRSLEEFAATLKEKELVVFRRRMLAEDKATLQEISDELALSRERVRQIENRIREKLRAFIEKRGVESELVQQ